MYARCEFSDNISGTYTQCPGGGPKGPERDGLLFSFSIQFILAGDGIIARTNEFRTNFCIRKVAGEVSAPAKFPFRVHELCFTMRGVSN